MKKNSIFRNYNYKGSGFTLNHKGSVLTPNYKASGFTLLEMVIVIIIIGVLASLALPQLFSMVEGAKAAEAITAIATIRMAMERKYLMEGTYKGPVYINANLPQLSTSLKVNHLDISDPGLSPGAVFDYYVIGDINHYSIEASLKSDLTKKIGFSYNCTVSYNTSSGSTSMGFDCTAQDNKYHWAGHKVFKNYLPRTN